MTPHHTHISQLCSLYEDTFDCFQIHKHHFSCNIFPSESSSRQYWKICTFSVCLSRSAQNSSVKIAAATFNWGHFQKYKSTIQCTIDSSDWSPCWPGKRDVSESHRNVVLRVVPVYIWYIKFDSGVDVTETGHDALDVAMMINITSPPMKQIRFTGTL